jgi:hypothetical protein
VREFGLPSNLKLSVHSGSDKLSIYRPIRTAIREFDAGIHLKTAGTTWLEELTGLALAGGQALETAKQIYEKALPRFDELCGPYATVIDIDPARLPKAREVEKWDGQLGREHVGGKQVQVAPHQETDEDLPEKFLSRTQARAGTPLELQVVV